MYKIDVPSAFTLTGMVLGYFLTLQPVSAQIRPDGTTSTNITREQSPHDEFSRHVSISGTSFSRDKFNLFHSFEQFTIPDRTRVRFDPSGAENIIVRVTGNRRSQLSGRLEVANRANLFLLNPNGIVFRGNTQLDIGGTFVATTADAIAFGDRGEFSAIEPNTNTALLTVQPSALRFLRNDRQAIRNQARLDLMESASTQPSNPSLVFVGGLIQFNENNPDTAEGDLVIPRGRLQLAAVGGIGEVGYSADTETITVPDAMQRGQVVFEDVVVDVGAGQLTIDAGVIRSTAARLQASTTSDRPTSIRLRASDSILLTNTSQIDFSSGDIFLEATETIRLNDRSSINGSAIESFSGGSIRIRSENLTVSNASSINARTFSVEDAGEIFLDVDQTIRIISDSQINSLAATSANANPLGNAGSITIRTSLLQVEDDATLSSSAIGNRGRAGDILIQAQTVTLDNDSNISAGVVGNEIGGNITLRNLDFLLLGENNSFSVAALANGDGGDLSIDADIIVAIPDQNNDLIAKALEGRGGNIEITTRGIFGLDVREAVEGNITNDIDASSRFGVDGVVSINRLEVDPSRSLEDLPDEVVNVASLVDENACRSLGISEFIIVGEGGVPPSRDMRLSADAVWEDWRLAFVPEEASVISSDDKLATAEDAAELDSTHTSPTMVEAVNWIVKEDGEIELVPPEPRYATPIRVSQLRACR